MTDTVTAFATVRLVVNAGDAVDKVMSLEGEEHDAESLASLGIRIDGVTFGDASDVAPID